MKVTNEKFQKMYITYLHNYYHYFKALKERNEINSQLLRVKTTKLFLSFQIAKNLALKKEGGILISFFKRVNEQQCLKNNDNS